MIDRQKAAAKLGAMTIQPLRICAALSVSVLMLGISSGFAESEKIPEIKTVSGKTYQNAQVTKVTPSDISIMHDSGVARIPLKDLPDELKAKFGYDPEKAEAHATARAQADAQNAAAVAKAELAARQRASDKKRLEEAKQETFKVIQILKKENGILANFYTPGGAPGAGARAAGALFGRSSSAVAPSTGELVFLSGELLPNLVDNVVIQAKVVEDGVYDDGDVTIKKLKVLQMKIYDADSE